MPTQRRRRTILITVSIGVLVLVVLGATLVHRADHRVNHIPLGATPRPVTVVKAQSSEFRDSRSYVGAIDSWIEASVGPQYISAYVDTVLVRPGATVTRGQVLATLDCSHPTAATRSAAMQARAVSERQRATADEAAREATMLDGGFIAPNEVEQKQAQSTSERAQLLEAQARLESASQDVNDCTLRAPFDGEVATRGIDPGAFVTPGTSIVSIVDRSIVRAVVDAPEKDFDIATPSTPVHVVMLATGANVEAMISRRAPKADPKTRTVHFEIDIADPERKYPTGTTATIHVDIGHPVPATEVPLYSAVEQEGKSTLFVIENDVARRKVLQSLGESGGKLYFDPKILPANATVVTEGRALLSDGEPVKAQIEPAQPTSDQQRDAGVRGGGYGRPL